MIQPLRQKPQRIPASTPRHSHQDGRSTAAKSANHPAETDAPSGSTGTTSDNEDRSSAALALLQLQAEMRKAKTVSELGYFLANETRAVLRAQQIVVFARGPRKDLVVHTVSSLTTVDRSSPLVLWFESLPKCLAREGYADKIRDFEASAFPGGFADVEQAYPLRHLLWLPLTAHDGQIASAMILARSVPWGDQDAKIAAYLADAFSHAWSALSKGKRLSLVSGLLTRRVALTASVVAGCLMAVPVPMTAIAPVEVSPREAFIVTPGVEGIVRSVEVEPNAVVRAGQILVTLNDTNLRNRAEIAVREVLVAETKYKKAAQLAFVDPRGRHEMAIARSELDLKLAERDFARELLDRTTIRTARDGVAFFADKKDLIGRPVAVGEKLMEVANPASSEFSIDLPAADAIVLTDRARVKIFLDADPLHPIEAHLVRASYKAAPREGQQFAFRVIAEAEGGTAENGLRLGMRGSAQIYSHYVPLGFYLFRRPIAAARQWSGL